MCGIAGIIGREQGDISIEQMLNRISHRGPDGLFYHKQDHIAFGHARLSIIDLSTNGNQPMTDPASGNIIVFNGEIYNYLEIKSAIRNQYKFQTDSDTEVILAAYAVYGINFLSHLRGMFAFALFDKQSGNVLIARDRFGIKPFYYRKFTDQFLFASEIKALINFGSSGEEVNELKAYEFLANMQLDTDEQTMFKGVYQLLPATYTWINKNGVMQPSTSYWDFPQPGNMTFDKNAKEELIDMFDKTISIHLRSDVPVGCFVSGGIDSSSVACFSLRNMQQNELNTFSAVLPYFHPENNLIKDVEAVSDKIKPHQFVLNGDGFFDEISSIIYHHDEPILDGSMYAHYKLCEIAQQNRIKVLLSGSGGDELFGGYASHVHAQHAKLIAGVKFSRYVKDIVKTRKNSSITLRNLVIKSLYETVPLGIRQQLKKSQVRKKITHLNIRPDFPHYYHKHADPYFANMINNYRSWSAPPFLHYEDRNSMAFGVETRVPFFDHSLVEFILRFATNEIVSGESKSLLRNSFKGIVPDKVLSQKGKFGFPSPIDHALKEDAIGKAMFYDLCKQTPLLKQRESQNLADKFYKGEGDVSIYWRTLSYMIWYKIFFNDRKNYFA
jgi:asparagine synthase (glutamine-hydrolysing)